MNLFNYLALKDLKTSVKKIEDLCAWLELKESERNPTCHTNLAMYDPTESDIKVEYGFFIKVSVYVKKNLSRLPSDRREHIKKALEGIERRVYLAMKDINWNMWYDVERM